MEKIVSPYFDGGKQTFMVFSMLLLGVAFLLGVYIAIDRSYLYASLDLLNNIQNKYNISGYVVISTVLLAALSVGYSLYLLSFAIISSPTFILRRYSISNTGIRAEVFKRISRIHPNISLAIMSDTQRYAYLYINTTRNDDSIAQTIRFAFTQVIFGRSMLLVFLICEYISISYIDILLLFFIMFISWVCCVLLYFLSTLYMENLMNSAFIINNEKPSLITLEK